MEHYQDENKKALSKVEKIRYSTMDGIGKNTAQARSERRMKKLSLNMRFVKVGDKFIPYQSSKKAMDTEKCTSFCTSMESMLKMVQLTINNSKGTNKTENVKRKSMKAFRENTDNSVISAELEEIKNCPKSTKKSDCPVMIFIVSKIQELQIARGNKKEQERIIEKELNKDVV